MPADSPVDPSSFSAFFDASAAASMPPPAVTASGPGELAVISRQLGETNAMLRDLLRVQSLQLEIMKRGEERMMRQLLSQKEDFERWLVEYPELSQGSKEAADLLRRLLGETLDGLVRYVRDNEDGLADSDYVRDEMVTRYGNLLNHGSAMYGLVRRISTMETPEG